MSTIPYRKAHGARAASSARTTAKTTPAKPAAKSLHKAAARAKSAKKAVVQRRQVTLDGSASASRARVGSYANLAKFLGDAVAMPIAVRVEMEQAGVPAGWIDSFATRLKRPRTYVFDVLGVPLSTGKRLAASNASITGSAGHAAVALGRLLASATEMAHDARADDRDDFDVGEWLAGWLDTANPSLGSVRPRDLMGTPTGALAVERALGSVLSGAYQ